MGYWAWLLKQAGVEVVATDELPTTKCAESCVNKYHGNIPPLTDVEEAPANVAAQHPCASAVTSEILSTSQNLRRVKSLYTV